MTDIIRELIDSLSSLSKRVRNLETRGFPVYSGGGSIAGQNHALLDNLDFLNSGHTGFEPEKGANDLFVTFEEKALIHSINSLIVPDPSTFTGYSIILYNRSANTVGYYAPTADGFMNALLTSDNDSLIVLPNCMISGNFVIPSGVSIAGMDRSKCGFIGAINLQDGCSLENVTVSNSVDTTVNAYAVLVEGTVNISDCIISAANPSGLSAGVYLADALCELKNCIVHSSGLFGYAYYSEGSILTIYGGSADGSTALIGVLL